MDQLATMMLGVLGRPVGPDDLEPFTLSLIERFRASPGDAAPRAVAAVELAGERMRAYLNGYDVVLCPTVPVAPFAIGTLAPTLDRETLIRRTEKLAGYTPIHNMAGVPAMSVPLFTASAGWPIGIHFAARVGGEATLLGLAYQLEEAAPWRDRWPAIATSLGQSPTPA
jgi:amidase